MSRVKLGSKIKIDFSKDIELYHILYPFVNGKQATVIKMFRPVKSKGYPYVYTVELKSVKKTITLMRDEFILLDDKK